MTEVSRRDRGFISARHILFLLWTNWAVICVSALVCAVLALGVSLLQTPKYESTATLYVTSGVGDNSAAAYQGSLASQQRVISYTKLATSDAVLAKALQSSALPIDRTTAKADVSASSSASTVLVYVTATAESPSLAADLANAVSSALVDYVSVLESPSNGGGPLAKLTVVTPATPNTDATSPQTYRNVLAGLLLGAVIGSLGVIIWPKVSSRVSSESDLVEIVDKPLLGRVPTDPLLRDKGILEFHAGSSHATEEFRKIRSNLAFINVDSPPRVILIGSAEASEGKTTVAINLAIALAESDNRVVVVDADLRRPQISNRLGTNGSVGITTMLSGGARLSDVITASHYPGLDVIGSGPHAPNPAELLETQRMGDLLRQLAENYDYVIVDAAPLLPVADSISLIKWVDAALLVARAGRTNAARLARAIDLISLTQIPVVGVVLTDAKRTSEGSGYWYSYGSNDPAAADRSSG
ncbi:polysaccharide biosynthesis tyrosine autokinase [Gordonia sp. w5E2]|uniref:polysaccharide biosynthesis tyrosine autokinase n=1 Tax=Gordonia TaxID=2053 RepID=UPI0022E5B6F1|nr:polysaccharide biosynthesis tyrosine autokinase [Gordonia jacobaea]